VASSIALDLLTLKELLDLFHLAIIFFWQILVCALDIDAYATEVLSDGIVDDKKLQKMKSNMGFA
ncbi:hypothetical protein ACJX0J_024151, partial [Zea mays]